MSQIGYHRRKAELRALARFEARYPGRCLACAESIEIGDTLRWDDNYAIHAACTSLSELEAEIAEWCPTCFLVIPLNGKCECE